MKRKVISVFLILILFLSLTITVFAAQEDTFVMDKADLLSNQEETELSRKLSQISQTYGAQIIVATESSTESGSADAHVAFLYDTMGFGYGENHDGVLLLVCMDLREYRILSNGFAAAAIESGEIDAIGEVIVSDLSDGDYADAFAGFAEECVYYLNGYLNGFPFRLGQNLVIALVVGIVVGLIVVFILKAQLKSVRKQNQADVYVKPGSMHVTVHRDLFLYRNVTRTKRESSSSGSSHSGSSRNIGGGSF